LRERLIIRIMWGMRRGKIKKTAIKIDERGYKLRVWLNGRHSCWKVRNPSILGLQLHHKIQKPGDEVSNTLFVIDKVIFYEF